MMRTVFIILGFVMFLLPVAARAQASADPFDGKWTWSQGKESLELTLDQNGEALTGFHIAIGQDGNKVDDAGEELVPSITGLVEGNMAKIDFASAFPDGGTGTATLTLKNGKLEWLLAASHGEHYFPKKAELLRAAQ